MKKRAGILILLAAVSCIKREYNGSVPMNNGAPVPNASEVARGLFKLGYLKDEAGNFCNASLLVHNGKVADEGNPHRCTVTPGGCGGGIVDDASLGTEPFGVTAAHCFVDRLNAAGSKPLQEKMIQSLVLQSEVDGAVVVAVRRMVLNPGFFATDPLVSAASDLAVLNLDLTDFSGQLPSPMKGFKVFLQLKSLPSLSDDQLNAFASSISQMAEAEKRGTVNDLSPIPVGAFDTHPDLMQAGYGLKSFRRVLEKDAAGNPQVKFEAQDNSDGKAHWIPLKLAGLTLGGELGVGVAPSLTPEVRIGLGDSGTPLFLSGKNTNSHLPWDLNASDMLMLGVVHGGPDWIGQFVVFATLGGNAPFLKNATSKP
jgi:hypothetical protein